MTGLWKKKKDNNYLSGRSVRKERCNRQPEERYVSLEAAVGYLLLRDTSCRPWKYLLLTSGGRQESLEEASASCFHHSVTSLALKENSDQMKGALRRLTTDGFFFLLYARARVGAGRKRTWEEERDRRSQVLQQQPCHTFTFKLTNLW